MHEGLTGAGSIAIYGPIGIRYQLVSTRPGQKILPGNPPYLWNQGWISIDDDNGMIEELRVTRTGMEWFPRNCRLATSFNWALDEGVTMRMVELLPEPVERLAVLLQRQMAPTEDPGDRGPLAAQIREPTSNRYA